MLLALLALLLMIILFGALGIFVAKVFLFIVMAIILASFLAGLLRTATRH